MTVLFLTTRVLAGLADLALVATGQLAIAVVAAPAIICLTLLCPPLPRWHRDPP